MTIATDLHIHSTLSPCASLEMSPAAIVRRARELALDVIAVTDHNSVENGFTAARLGEKIGLKVLFGMEAQTREDVHVLCLFEDRRQAERFNERVYALLPDVDNNPDLFGDQVVVDEQDNIVRQEEKLLLNALDISVAGPARAGPAHTTASPSPPMSRRRPTGCWSTWAWCRPNSTARRWRSPASRPDRTFCARSPASAATPCCATPTPII